MPIEADYILAVLDSCCDAFTFPMLDNGYVYLAATRLSLFRNAADWAIVFEVFGFSPRSGLPDTHIYTFASTLFNRDTPEKYAKRDAYERYLANNPNNDSRFVYPMDAGDWQDSENDEIVAEDATVVMLRDQEIRLPSVDEYTRGGIVLEDAPRVRVFELCRYLAVDARQEVLATSNERRISVPPDIPEILQLQEWHHPNVVDSDDRPSGSETFRQLAKVLATGDVGLYRPSQPPNTHWRNWPEGGRL